MNSKTSPVRGRSKKKTPKPKPSSSGFIEVRGAREHNLKNIDINIPRNKLVVITGLSGSGKSSLAFDTIYAEGQRRYLESLSSYARQFLDKLKKPEVDYISGLSPSIAIDQKSTTHNPRSTVATVTELYDFLRLLYAKAGIRTCPTCKIVLSRRSADALIEDIQKQFKGREVRIFAPMIKGRKGEFQKLFADILKKGYSRARVDGKIKDLAPEDKLRKSYRHDIEVLIDHLLIEEDPAELEQAVRAAIELTQGAVMIEDCQSTSKKKEHYFSTQNTCPQCLASFSELTPNMFSFNSPYGACEACRGLGKLSQILEGGVIANEGKSLLGGGLNKDLFFSFNKYFIEELVYDLSKAYQFDWNDIWKDWPNEAREAFFWGDSDHTGIIEMLEKLFHETGSEQIRRKVRKFLKEDICSACAGKRLKAESLGVLIDGKNISELTALSIDDAHHLFQDLKLEHADEAITRPILKEVASRLLFLYQVGLGYLTLHRSVATLAGGELQRIRLAAQIGVGLTGVLYVLDEPSIGLHPRDNEKLIRTLEKLRDMKNTVLVVEHDEETMRRADHVIDLGPGAGRKGGRVTAEGRADQLSLKKGSLTAAYLTGKKSIQVPDKRKTPHKGEWIELKGCSEHNLKRINVKIPLGLFVCVTGVSGSGKSTLVHDTLYKELHNRLWKTDYAVGKFKSIKGIEKIDKVIEIDQSPIGRTPRSNPATYTDLFGFIRKLYSDLQDSKIRKYTASRFSFNLKGGRCETCRGDGFEKLQMSFMSDIYVLCEDCKGNRYNDSTLEVRYKDKNIAEVLDMSVSEAKEFFTSFSTLQDKLEMLEQVGLGYVKLGQPSTTLSGGEAQRIKLVSELSKRSTGKTLYLLDEPTTGLHFGDIENLMQALLRLRDQGNSILVIEHNLDVIKMADYLIDLGPEGGPDGGRVIASGTPEEVAQVKASKTAAYLKPLMNN